ncbi:hypothetical protein Dda_0357 [Drechslerella dactyloides]|uniref:Atg29 N-terminal domain-containing protein n=1 Tax=Drechslerella dactyloides TaxID=74499 RepID=A0AAD6J659_DREDA|nr:hypothetical protein Dda_0357 [Drechslerella dactyloides]
MPLENVPRPPYPTATTAFADLPGPPLPPVPSTPTLAASRQITPGTTMPAGGQTISRRGTPSAGTPPEQPPEVKYTVFLRLPFPRNDFVDPPPVAWLYERELSQVRAQLRKVGTTGTPLNSPGTPVPGANGQRALSAAGAEISRPSSAVANRPVMGGTPMSRTSSRNVPVQPVTSNSEDQAAAVAASTAGVVAAPPLSNGNGSVPMSRTPSASTARAPPTQSSQYFPTTPTLAGLDLYSLQQQPGEYQLASSPNGLTDLSPTPIRRSPSPSSSSSHSSRSSDVSSAVGTEHDENPKMRPMKRKAPRSYHGPKAPGTAPIQRPLKQQRHQQQQQQRHHQQQQHQQTSKPPFRRPLRNHPRADTAGRERAMRVGTSRIDMKIPPGEQSSAGSGFSRSASSRITLCPIAEHPHREANPALDDDYQMEDDGAQKAAQAWEVLSAI